MVNGAGQVVGITVAASVNYRMGPGGKGFAIPINDALGIANQIRNRAPSEAVHIGPPALLGVGVRTAPRDAPGVIVQEVLRGGPAEQAGLIDGDILTSIDGTPIASATELTFVLDRHYAGQVIDVTWIDQGGAQRTARGSAARLACPAGESDPGRRPQRLAAGGARLVGLLQHGREGDVAEIAVQRLQRDHELPPGVRDREFEWDIREVLLQHEAPRRR